MQREKMLQREKDVKEKSIFLSNCLTGVFLKLNCFRLRRESMGDDSRIDDCILQEILSRLPAKSLAQCKCISKRWHDLISSPVFIKTQVTRSLNNPLGILTVNTRLHGDRVFYIPLDGDRDDTTNHPDTTLGLSGRRINKVYIRAVSNGLLFCRVINPTFTGHKNILGNPTTKSFRRTASIPHDGIYSKTRFGLAFDPSVSPSSVKLVGCKRNRGRLMFDIYSPRTDTWRQSAATARSAGRRLFDTVSSVYVRGALHWLVEVGDIVAFDVERERAYTVRMPVGVEAVAIAGYSDVWLGVVKGRMSIVKMDKGINVWEMEDYKSGKWDFKECVEMLENDVDGDRRGYYRTNVPLLYDGEKCVTLTWMKEEEQARCGLAVYRFGSGRWDPIRRLEEWMESRRHFYPYISHSIEVNWEHQAASPRKRVKLHV